MSATAGVFAAQARLHLLRGNRQSVDPINKLSSFHTRIRGADWRDAKRAL